MDFGEIRAVSFDCYGTLIDWESGILDALPSLRANPEIADTEILEAYGKAEATAESGDFIPYREVLRRVTRAIAERFGAEDIGEDALAESLPQWGPFADTVASLQRLKQRYRLVIISNIDDDLFAATSRHLGVSFDHVVTAEQVRSYKPSPAHFRRALEVAGLAPGRLLHVAQSRYHDIAPTNALGIPNVWVNRRSIRPGDGATEKSDAVPRLEVPDLGTLVDIIDEATA